MATASAEKLCPGCERRVPLESFYKRTKSKDGLQRLCKTCDQASALTRYHTTYKLDGRQRRWSQNSEYKRKYGITLKDFEKGVEEQGGICPLCQNERQLCVDHDHETGEVRGYICRPCNLALGLVTDGPETLGRMIEYLKVKVSP